MEAQRSHASRSRAQLVVGEINRHWAGRAIDEVQPVMIEGIDLISPPTAWPPRLRVRFRMRGEALVWEQVFDWSLDHGTPADGAASFAAIAWQNLVELAELGWWPNVLTRPHAPLTSPAPPKSPR